MTVKELIEELSKYPANMIVFVNDSEWGAEQLSEIVIRKDEWIWDGPKHTVQDVLCIK